MEQREKLIELLDIAFLDSDDNYGIPNREQVADHLLANGVVVLPCKVGDTVYEISSRMCKEKIRCNNTCYECDGTESWNNCFRESDTPFAVEFEYDMIDEIDKTIFLTKEEAEEALAKRKGGD